MKLWSQQLAVVHDNFIVLDGQVFDVFDVKGDGVLEFGEFVRGLSVFHPNSSEEEKIDCKLCNISSLSIQ